MNSAEMPPAIAPVGEAAAVTGTPGTPVTAIAIPYFQWDNRERRADAHLATLLAGGTTPQDPPGHGGATRPPIPPWPWRTP